MPLRPDMQPQEFLEIFLRRKWLIVFSILFILFGASVYCVVTPERFKSSTTILVVPQRVPENYVKSTISIGIEDRLGTIKQQVLSRTRLVAVMDELGLFKEDRKKYPVEEVVDEMRKRITIEVRHTDAFTLSFVHENRQMAMLTTSRLASFFIDENLKNREQQAVGTADFLDSQLQETKKKLEEQEERVKKYKSDVHGGTAAAAAGEPRGDVPAAGPVEGERRRDPHRPGPEDVHRVPDQHPRIAGRVVRGAGARRFGRRRKRLPRSRSPPRTPPRRTCPN